MSWENEPKLTATEQAVDDINSGKNVGERACKIGSIAILELAEKGIEKGLLLDLAAAITCFVNSATQVESMDFLLESIEELPAGYKFDKSELVATFKLIRSKSAFETNEMAQTLKRSMLALQMLRETSSESR